MSTPYFNPGAVLFGTTATQFSTGITVNSIDSVSNTLSIGAGNASQLNIGTTAETITLGGFSSSLTIGCQNITVGDSGSSIIIGANGNNVCVGQYSQSSDFGKYSPNVTLGAGSQSVAVGTQSGALTVGSYAANSSFGNNCGTVAIGTNSQNLNLGVNGNTIAIGSYAASMSIGSNTNTINIGSNSQNIAIGNNSQNIAIGSNSQNVSILSPTIMLGNRYLSSQTLTNCPVNYTTAVRSGGASPTGSKSYTSNILSIAGGGGYADAASVSGTLHLFNLGSTSTSLPGVSTIEFIANYLNGTMSVTTLSTLTQSPSYNLSPQITASGSTLVLGVTSDYPIACIWDCTFVIHVMQNPLSYMNGTTFRGTVITATTS